jgi:ankyrin repeat protein
MDAAEDANGGPLLALVQGGSSVTSTNAFTKQSLLQVWVGHDSRRVAYKEAFTVVTETLLEQQDALVVRDHQGRTLLHHCLDSPYEDDFQYLSTLVLSKASYLLEAQDDNGRTPLLQAVQIKVSDDDNSLAASRSKWLCDNGANMKVLDKEGCGFLMLACGNDELSDQQCMQLIQRQLQAMPDAERRSHVQSSRSHKNLMTPLMLACDNSFVDVVKYLVSLTDDINGLSKFKLTALDFALNQALYMRQIRLNMWSIDGIIKWDKNGRCFKPQNRRFRPDSLQCRELLFKDRDALEALFQRPHTEADLCE